MREFVQIFWQEFAACNETLTEVNAPNPFMFMKVMDATL